MPFSLSSNGNDFGLTAPERAEQMVLRYVNSYTQTFSWRWTGTQSIRIGALSKPAGEY